ncbi:uncharacterized protein LOC107372206 [Tetranychus urticae]|uniref:Gustatory receptor n=1 Tax=Tetranychus urticae TaxID=32264 RepID=T1JZ05_TETUR|nr:uncharacterized protein LOC107372206 [Tetranychus urticae]
MQHQFEQRKSFSHPSSNPKEGLYGNIPKLSYETWFKIFGLLSSGLDHERRFGPIKQDRTPVKIKRLYCQLITAMLWFFAVRGFVLMFIDDKGLAILMGDLSVYWNDYRMYYLMPTFYYAFSSALVATTFLLKERDLSWFIPFMTFSQHQSTDPNDKLGFHRWRTLIFTLFNLTITMWVTGSMGYLTYSSARDNMDAHTFRLFMPWLVVQVIWYFFMTGIIMFTTSYFNLVCLMVQKKFSDVASEIETLAEGDPGPPGSKNDDLTRLYFAHNDLCEITDESNSFWQYILFYIIGNFIPNFCYVMYTLFFGDLDTPLAIFSWFILGHTFLIMAVLSVSAADVSSEAHAPYTSLHTLSLLQLPIDIEVNMSTFLHRVRGPTIGYSILDLFVITNSSISNTVAAIASYFLIVADFSRSTVNQGLIQKAQSKQKAINESLAMTTTSSMLDATTIASIG